MRTNKLNRAIDSLLYLMGEKDLRNESQQTMEEHPKDPENKTYQTKILNNYNVYVKEV